jgi:hypothetical protein
MFDDEELMKYYLSKYCQNNRDSLDLDWGIQMALFILSNYYDDMDTLENLYPSLLRYPENYYINKAMVIFLKQKNLH